MNENLILLHKLFDKFEKNKNENINLESFKIILNILKLPLSNLEERSYGFNDLLTHIENNYKMKKFPVIKKNKIKDSLKSNFDDTTINFILDELSKNKTKKTKQIKNMEENIELSVLKKYYDSLLLS